MSHIGPDSIPVASAQMKAIDAMTEAKPTSPITEVFTNLMRATDRLYIVTEQLEERIAMVTAPTSPAPPDTAPGPAVVPGNSSLLLDLHNQVLRLTDLADRVDELRRRVEV